MKKRTLTLVVALVLVSVLAVGGTLAWLTAQTQTVTNTFTVGNINLTLEETDVDNNGSKLENTYDLIPGTTYVKDPKVTVVAGSEACYLFVRVMETNCEGIINYSLNAEWKPVQGHDDYYYRMVEAVSAEEGAEYYILAGGEGDYKNGMVTIDTGLTKEAVDADGFVTPQLSFIAAAVQSENVTDVETAFGYLPEDFTK